MGSETLEHVKVLVRDSKSALACGEKELRPQCFFRKASSFGDGRSYAKLCGSTPEADTHE